MAHEITKTDNLFVTRTAAWHGLGTVVQSAPNSAEAIKLAGLDWEVRQSPAQYLVGEELRSFEDRHVNYRSDNGDALGVVGSGYTIVQNNDAFEFTDHLLGEGVHYETAGSIKGGQNIWLLARLPEKKILSDEIVPYLLFVNGHDGRTAAQVCMTPVRVVCQNTLNLALRRSQRKWSFYHSTNVMTKINEARATIKLAGKYMETLEEQAERLAAEKLSADQIHSFVQRLFPADGGKVALKNTMEKIERFQACYNADDVANFKGTKWGLILAMSDYTSHVPLKDQKQRERHLSKTIISADKMLDQAFQMVGVM